MSDHSSNFEKVKRYYNNKYWRPSAIADAVECGWITAEEYAEITGETYVPDEERELSAAEFVNILIGGET